MVNLSVNVNKIALLRNSRGGDRPDLLGAARTCIETGCQGITVHPRPDERHIRRKDVYELAKMLGSDFKEIEFNIEGYPSSDWLNLVCEVKPTQATLVPDDPNQLTSDHGWDLKSGRCDWLRAAIQRLKTHGIRVSLFLDPDVEQVESARTTNADRIELYTERYAKTYGTNHGTAVYADYVGAAQRAQAIGLGLNAGHDLNLDNLRHFSENIPGLLEVSIGHALVCDALEMGLVPAVKAYLKTLNP
ncbi:MAG: pyridoxine 5'-phosphate synthase [Phycisphaerales bacterium]|nr:pyridoxine 5'-phosphate synthase [Phycisphaerales bacterium]